MSLAKAVIIAQVDPAVRAELEQRAKQGDRTPSAEIRRALRAHLERTQTTKEN
jgi:predicted transcriptional regulator